MRHAQRCRSLALAINLLCLRGTALATYGDLRVGLNTTQTGVAGAVVTQREVLQFSPVLAFQVTYQL